MHATIKLLGALLASGALFLCSAQSVTIDCGSASDQYFTGGAAYTVPNVTGDATLRYGTFSYSIPATPGAYNVSLFLRDTGTVGQRVFSVRINSTPVLTGLDLVATVGLAEVQRDFQTVSVGGKIFIEFTYEKKSAVVSRIVLTPILPSQATGKSEVTTTSQVITMNPGIVRTSSKQEAFTTFAHVNRIGGNENGLFTLGYNNLAQRACYYSLGIVMANYTVDGFTGNTCSLISSVASRDLLVTGTVAITGGIFGIVVDSRPDSFLSTVQVFGTTTGLLRIDADPFSVAGTPTTPEMLASPVWLRK